MEPEELGRNPATLSAYQVCLTLRYKGEVPRFRHGHPILGDGETFFAHREEEFNRRVYGGIPGEGALYAGVRFGGEGLKEDFAAAGVLSHREVPLATEEVERTGWGYALRNIVGDLEVEALRCALCTEGVVAGGHGANIG